MENILGESNNRSVKERDEMADGDPVRGYAVALTEQEKERLSEERNTS